MPDLNQKTLNDVKEYFLENRTRYLNLLQEIKNFIEKIRRDHLTNKIYRYYSRIDNRDENDELKSIERTVSKLVRWRREHGDDWSVRNVHDIVGVSIVVFYESDITDVFNTIKQRCINHNLLLEPYLSGEEKIRFKDYGYHAQHLVLSSQTPNLIGLKCEIQIKTLLHDAWHAKTHDLTYDPQGELGDEHKRIMESFGESIQALEIQSEMIRTLITQDWNEEEDLRHSARVHMTDWLENLSFSTDEITKRYVELLQCLLTQKEKFKNCSIANTELRKLISEIEQLRGLNGGLEAAWPLMLSAASIRRDNHLNYIAKDYLKDWLKTEEDPARKCFYLSFGYHSIGERHEAIREIEDFLRQSNEDDHGSEYRQKLKFNVLYYLIEEAAHFPNKAPDLKSRCDRLIEEIGLEESKELPKTAIKDTIGYYHIIFGKNKSDIEKGIRLCQAAYMERSEIDGTQERYQERFMMLHERIGWRRYLSARN